MTNDLTATPVAPAKRGKGLLITGAVLLVLGILATILGVAVVGNSVEAITETQVGASQSAPTTITGPLDAATTCAVYEAAHAGKGTVQVTDVTVTSAAGGGCSSSPWSRTACSTCPSSCRPQPPT